uniref:hypothetical protein n=1 Tax=Alloprevotella sp. TaxID=1872471 RepID=UPI003FEDAAD8
MKKLLRLLAMLLCVFALIACGDDDNDDNITEGKDGVYVINGHKFVDLGLPSGLLWATRNVGAESIYEIGNYYSWGEIEPKNNYTLTTYKWFDGDEFTKYTPEDGKRELDAADDVATVKWGKKCRLPKFAEAIELVTKCKWEWRLSYDNQSINGYLVTGPNGNSIFLPAAGSNTGSLIQWSRENGDYLLKDITQRHESNQYIEILTFWERKIDPTESSFTSSYRVWGHSVRPVATK